MSRPTEGFSAMTSVFGTRDTLAKGFLGAVWTPEALSARLRRSLDTGSGETERLLPLRRPAVCAARLWDLPAAGARQGARPARGRLRAGGEPQLQLRPLGARVAALPAPVPALHGEVGALLVAAQVRARRGRRVPRAARRAGRAGDADGGRPLPRRPRCRDVPGEDPAAEGAAQEVGGASALGRGA